ncbi:response regulator transcription factor [Paraglaciecola chathamensis]|uniref:response regulator transcription factor n=1 Tax=Paraglaciecola chathamensis TaxID=368405 RepID=UPI00270562AD|nr:response regulator transcription factor [Paraglaciecola chathamensis]MDO6559234.1 response regulator transcription factor [Paraglaciecola chathamensis]
MRILLIEDSATLRNSLSLGLDKLGYSVDVAADGTTGLSMALMGDYEIVILDLMLPELDGLAILKALRKRNLNVRVLILSARSQTDDKVSGILSGADDYLTKPFSFDELSARLVSLMRRGPATHANDRIEINDFVLNLQSKSLSYHQQDIELTPNEYKIIECMFLNRDRVVTSERLSEYLSGNYDHTSKNAIEAHLSSARKKAKNIGASLPIKSKRGFGYKIVGINEVNS